MVTAELFQSDSDQHHPAEKLYVSTVNLELTTNKKEFYIATSQQLWPSSGTTRESYTRVRSSNADKADC